MLNDADSPSSVTPSIFKVKLSSAFSDTFVAPNSNNSILRPEVETKR